MVPYNCQRIVITIILMVSGSWILSSLGKEVGRKEGLLAYYVGGTLDTVPKPWDRTAGCSLSWRPLAAAPPTLPGATSSLWQDQPARQAAPAPPPGSLINSLSNPPGVEIPAANALPRRESPQHRKERSPRLGGRWEVWEVGTEGLI